jgi:hypothetical protein
MSSRVVERGFLVLLLVALARHVWLAAYVHPYADDFSYAAVGMRTELSQRLASEYEFWNGRYFTNILVLRGPITLGWELGLPLYRVVPVLLMGLTWWSAFAFIRALFGPALRVRLAVIGSVLFLLAFLNAMPDASEGFYWYTGAVTYQLPNALTLFLAAIWIRHWRGEHRMGTGRMLLAAMLLVIIAGCNELHMTVMVLGHAATLLWRYVVDRRVDRTVFLFFLLAVCCAVVVAMAPGNAVRGAHFPGKHDLWVTFGSSLAQTGRFLLTWELTTLLLPLSFLLVAWFRRWCDAHGIPTWCRMDRWLAFAIPIFLVFVSMVLPFWSTGVLGQYRTVNAALFLFLPTWAVAWCVWDVQVLRAHWPRWPVLRDGQMPWLAACTAVLFLCWGRDARVTSDLLTGRAARYNTGMMHRFDAIQAAVQEGKEEIVLPPLSEEPRSLIILQPSSNPGHWMNRSMGQYFGNEELRIRVANAE